MSKTVTVRRGEKLPENMVGGPFAVPVNSTIVVKPGAIYPNNAIAESITVEVHDDSPQAYLIVPCEPGKGTHWHEQDDTQLWGCTKASAVDSTHKQIPFPLTLEDLRWAWGHTSASSDRDRRFAAAIAAWSAVPQTKEASQ